jgi:hypothetical protein
MTCAMSAMIHGQIQTGMGGHIEYSEMHPGMLQESRKVCYWAAYWKSLLRCGMTSLAMQKMFYTKHLLGKSTTTLKLFMLTRKCSVIKSCILAQYYLSHCSRLHSAQSYYFCLGVRRRLLRICYFGTLTDEGQTLLEHDGDELDNF